VAGGTEVNEKEIKDKYDSLKIKYRVSKRIMNKNCC